MIRFRSTAAIVQSIAAMCAGCSTTSTWRLAFATAAWAGKAKLKGWKKAARCARAKLGRRGCGLECYYVIIYIDCEGQLDLGHLFGAERMGIGRLALVEWLGRWVSRSLTLRNTVECVRMLFWMLLRKQRKACFLEGLPRTHV